MLIPWLVIADSNTVMLNTASQFITGSYNKPSYVVVTDSKKSALTNWKDSFAPAPTSAFLSPPAETYSTQNSSQCVYKPLT